MEEFKSRIEVEIVVNNGNTLYNDMSYGLMFHKIKGYESVEVGGILTLLNQKTLSSTKVRLVSFKNYESVDELKFLKHNRSFRLMDYLENNYVAKGKVIRVVSIDD